MERGSEHRDRAAQREAVQVMMPPTNEEKLRTIFLHQIPEGLGGDEGVQKLLGAVGRLRQWDSSASVLDEHKGTKFGFARFEDPESLSVAIKLLHEQGVEVPTKRQPGTSEAPKTDDEFEGIEKTKLQVAVDATSIAYVESFEENKAADELERALETARAAVKEVLRDLFYPTTTSVTETDRDVVMTNGENGENVEVVNIPLAQDDDLSDIPQEMREVVAGEIAAFRDRSIQRDMERLKKEEEMEERERLRSGTQHRSRLDSPPPSSGLGANNIPLGPRGSVPNAPSGPKGQNGTSRGVSFVNGGISNTELSIRREDEDTDASDGELNRRQEARRNTDQDKMYLEAERKWVNRERSRAAALERERDRENHDAESTERRRKEHIAMDKAWDDEREASRKSHPYYRDHGQWARKRAMDRAEEEARDEADRRAEREEQQREQAQVERARGMADSFLDRQAHEMEERDAAASAAAAAAPQPFKLSLGAAAQKNQASRGGAARRTMAEVEGLLDDEEADSGTRRQLIPIQYDASSASATIGMTDEEISQAVRALAQEIPSEKEGLWSWEVKWDCMDDGVIKEKLRPFVEKKIVEYLGVQEEMLVETVEEHLRKHGKAGALVEELEGVSFFPLPFFSSLVCCF